MRSREDECERCVMDALEGGLTASSTPHRAYFNVEQEDRAIRKFGVKYEDIFLTSKVRGGTLWILRDFEGRKDEFTSLS